MLTAPAVTLVTFLVFVGGAAPEGPAPVRVLIAYHSAGGHTRKLAEAVASGARSVSGVEVKLAPVGEASAEDVVAADAIVLGSPVYNAGVAPPVQEFINGWPFRGAPLRDKVGAAFVTAGGISAGEELVQVGLLHSMLIFGMVVVGGGDWRSAFGASGIVSEEPFGRQDVPGHVDDRFLARGEALGKRVAELAVRLRAGR
jgi:NAD(P)H dehydrogenase (quinone)